MSLPGKLVSLLVAGALVIWAAVGPRIFEINPATVATGRDPMLYVRSAPACISLKWKARIYGSRRPSMAPTASKNPFASTTWTAKYPVILGITPTAG